MGFLPALLAATVAVASPDDTLLISRADGAGGAKADIDFVLDGSSAGGISADGRYVAFDSDADNLVRGDDNQVSDIFVRDLRRHRNVLVTRAGGRRGELGDGHAGEYALSADGRAVAFTTQANNLHPDSPASYFPILVRDLRTHRTLLASRASGARGAAANNSSYEPAISGDGSVVAFHSDAANLHPDDRGERADVYARRLRTNRTLLVSRASGARGARGNGASEQASISADGRFVAFVSRASNLHPDDTDGRRDVYVRDLRRNVTTLVSPGDGESLEPQISADGRWVAFAHRRSSLLQEDPDPYRDVYLRDLRTGELTLVSVGAAGKSNGRDTSGPMISPDGRFVTFESNATNLDPADTDRVDDVFVRDRAAGETRLVSRASGAAGEKADSSSGAVGISTAGRILFNSDATNLHPDDRDDYTDAFVREPPVSRGSPPPARARPLGSRARASARSPAAASAGR